MGIYRHPPPPFIGGDGPLLPKDLPPSITAVPVNDPPFGLKQGLFGILSSWRARPVQLYPKRFLSQEFVAADDPPFGIERQLSLVASWIAEPTRLLPKRFLIQGAEVVDDPPFGLSQQLRLVDSWTVDPARLVARPRVVQGIAVPDVPPVKGRGAQELITRSWELLWSQPDERKRLLAAIIAVPSDNPAFGQRQPLLSVLDAWAPGPTDRVYRQFLVQGVAVNDPPFTQRNVLDQVLVTWRPFIPPPVYPEKLPASIIAVPENDPPFGVLTPLFGIIRSWQPGPPERVLFRAVVQEGVAPPVVVAEPVSSLGFGRW